MTCRTILMESRRCNYLLLTILSVSAVMLFAALPALATTIGADVSISGNTTVGNATSDTLTVTARLAADLDPNANSTINLGAYDLAFNDFFASGTSYLGVVQVGQGFGNTGISMSGAGVLSIDGAVWASSTFYVGSTGGGDDFSVTNNAVAVGTTANSSTLAVYGNTRFTGNLLPQVSHNNNYGLGAWDTAWGDTFTSGTLYSATSTIANNTGTSTLYILSNSGTLGGRIILEDTDGAGCSQISVLNGTLTTAPMAACPSEVEGN